MDSIIEDINYIQINEPVEFGSSLRKKFCLDPNTCHLTHGSFGAIPLKIRDIQHDFMNIIDYCPDAHFRFNDKRRWMASLEKAAPFIGCNPKDLVILYNATEAVNTVMKSFPLKKGDGILIYAWTYKAVRKICQRVAETTGAHIITVPLDVPIKDIQEVVANYKKKLDEFSNIKIAIIDHISSPTACVLPIKELISLCKEYNVATLIDGAHCPGHIPLNVESIGADFYTGNFHKWSFCPRGCCGLWVDPKYQDIVKPLVTSSSHGSSSDWRTDFIYQGSNNYTSSISLKYALRYYEEDLGGMDRISNYNKKLNEDATAYMVDKFKTESFPVPDEMKAPFMSMVKLPCSKQPIEDPGTTFSDWRWMTKALYDDYKVVSTIIIVDEVPWIRLFFQVYNVIEEYVTTTNAIIELLKSKNIANENI